MFMYIQLYIYMNNRTIELAKYWCILHALLYSQSMSMYTVPTYGLLIRVIFPVQNYYTNYTGVK